MFDPYQGIQPRQDAEMCVIGAILKDPYNVMPQVEQILSEDDFFIVECRNVFKCCSGFFIDGKDIDHIILTAQLGDAYKAFLVDCLSLMPSWSNWPAYAKIVGDTAKRIRAWDSFLELGEYLQSPTTNSDECREQAVNVCEALSSKESGDTLTVSDAFVKLYSSLQKTPEFYKTGFGKLDNHMAIKPGDFIIVSGAPSSGKTAFTLQAATKMSRKYKAVYFTLETGTMTMLTRMLANIISVDSRDIQYRNNLDYEKISKSKSIFDSLNLAFVEAAGYTVSQIKAKAVQLGADIIFIDYIGLISEEGKTEFEQIGNLSRKLHIMGQQSKITIFAIHQVNKEGEKNGKLSMKHLKNSNQIAYDADSILLLYSDSEAEEEKDMPVLGRTLLIDKNKEGPTGIIKMVFDKRIQRMTEVEEIREYDT